MSFTYRPTPVIVLSGKTVGDDHVPLRRLPAGTMQGYTPNFASPALNAIGRRTLKGDPWLISSGSMGKFVLGDDSLPPDFFSSLDASPIVPDTSSSLPPDFFGGLSTPPIVPTVNVPDLGPAPNIGIPGFPGSGGGGIPFLNIPGPAAPPMQSVPPGQTQATVNAGVSLATQIANFFKPTPPKATPMTAAQPGVYNAYPTQPSWFGQSTLMPGTPNSSVLFFGVGALVLFAVMAGGKK
jgi:hypothetical protein